MQEKNNQSFWKKILEFIVGLLTGVTLTLVYQGGQVNVNGNHNTVNYYNVCKDDTTLVWETQRIPGKDSFGRDVEFEIAILSQEKRWQFGRSDSLENNQPFEKFFTSYLKILPMIDSCSELIAIGVASQEGNDESQFLLADKRADKILEVLRPSSKGKNLYKLNLGKYVGVKTTKETSGQRRVIIGGIRNRDKAMASSDIKYALFDALKKQMNEKLGLELSDYKNFSFTNPN